MSLAVAPRMQRDSWQAPSFLLTIWLGVVSAYLYGVQVVQPGWALAAPLHREIVDGTAASPYRDRVLLPFTADLLSKVMSLESAYLLLYFVLFPAAYCSLFVLLRRWYPTTLALLGTALAAAVMPLALRDHYFQPGTWLELLLVTVALHLLARPELHLRLYAAVGVIAALNRETGVFLGLLLLVVAWPLARNRAAILTTAAAPAVVFITVRAWRGSGPPAEHDLLARNLHDISTALVQVTLFAAVPLFLLVTAWGAAPALLRRAMWVAPPYLALVACFGIWRETRLLVPLLPIVLGIGLAVLAGADGPVQQTEAS